MGTEQRKELTLGANETNLASKNFRLSSQVLSLLSGGGGGDAAEILLS